MSIETVRRLSREGVRSVQDEVTSIAFGGRSFATEGFTIDEILEAMEVPANATFELTAEGVLEISLVTVGTKG